MQVISASTIRPHYTGFDFVMLKDDESSPANKLTATDKLTATAQLGTLVKGTIDVKSCVFTAAEQYPEDGEMKLSDLFKEHTFDAVIKNEDGMLVLHATLPSAGAVMKYAACQYNVSKDLELETSEELTIEVKEGEAALNVDRYESSIRKESHFEHPFVSTPDGSVFHAKVENIMEKRQFAGVDYFSYVLPAHIAPTIEASVNEATSCDLTLTTLNGEQRTVSNKKVDAMVVGNAAEGIQVTWGYGLPSDGHIVDLDIRCPELKIQSYTRYASQKARFKIIDTTLDVTNEDTWIYEGVGLPSGAATSSLFVVAGLVASTLALFF